jgi:hypothetical protein
VLRTWTPRGIAWLDDLRRHESQMAMVLSLVIGAVVGLVVVGFILVTGRLDLGRALMVPPTVERVGKLSVNLHDPRYVSRDGGTATAYETWMGYIQDAHLRDKVEKLINSAAYERAGTGTDALVGGRRYDMLNTLVDRVQKEAKLKMLNQYPELKQDLMALQRAARVTRYSDERGQSILDRIR